ncbi:class I SAM-dependent DNA methyltransferase [Chloroflexota bacterium]
MKSFERYAKYYDLIYGDKDYEKECDFVEVIFAKFSINLVRTILDGGCGTGGHALPLARRGYTVTGIDSSEIVIEHAKQKAKESNLSPHFQLGDLRQLELGKKFDACLCMFAVLNYITGTEEIIETLKKIRGHLADKSLFICDFWNGLAVLRSLPSVRVKVVQNEKMKLIRIAEPELDAFNHICRVNYRLLIHEGDTKIDEIVETHVIRYYFPQEIRHYLKDAGFEVLKICPFMNVNGKVDETVWNIAAIAKAI